jgi:sulfur-carrier protein
VLPAAAYPDPMAQVRLFASMREAAGRAHDDVPGNKVAEVLDAAVDRYGPDFAARLQQCRVWVNGESVAADAAVTDEDEVAVLPPVSGG